MNNFNNQNSQWSESPSPDQQPFFLPFINPLVLLWQSQTLNAMLSRQSSTPIHAAILQLTISCPCTAGNGSAASSNSGAKSQFAQQKAPWGGGYIPTIDVHHPEWSLAIIPLTSFQAMPGWMKIMQALAGHGNPRQGTNLWPTQAVVRADDYCENLCSSAFKSMLLNKVEYLYCYIFLSTAFDALSGRS